MKNPLRKRLSRELKLDIGKYIALFLFLTATIGFVSGFLVADGSMKQAFDDSFKKYSVEDGHFTLATKADNSLIDKVEDKGVTLYNNFYFDKELDNGHTFRIFKNRDYINRASIFEGELPSADNEIAIDRLYAENNSLSLNDIVTVDDEDYKITTILSLSDYSALFKNNTDMMFDANKFTVALVDESAFNKFDSDNITYCYSWTNNDKTLSEDKRSELSDDVLDVVNQSRMMTDFVKQEDNQAITFTGNDMGSDKSMFLMLLYVVMVILAFVFSITTRNTIEQESSVIGTLRASGYTKAELVRHYLALPVVVTLVAAIVGNVLGYTFMKQIMVDMYYGSYSLPVYQTIWNAEAFILTTVIPCIIIFVVNLYVLVKALSIPPLQFLRHDIKRKKKKRAVKLPNFKFITRFRLRIILQNIPTYITIFIGIFLASVLLIFGLSMRPMLENFKTEIQNSMISNYQYLVKAPVETAYDDAEKFCATSLDTETGEEISVYGIEKNSTYLNKIIFSNKKNNVIVSDGYLEKYGLNVGDKITLNEKYDDESYTFTISDSYHYPATLAIFMPMDNFNDIFENGKDYFNGYFSNDKLDDVDEKLISAIITESDLTVMSDQLNDSMGSAFVMVTGFAILLYILMIYLLAKLVIEKNAGSISMVKILGYSNREAGKLYNHATAFVVIVSLLVNMPLAFIVFRRLFFIMMQEFNGWLTFTVSPLIYAEMFAIGIVCYFVIHFIQMKKIRKIPMSNVLKNNE